MIPASLLDVIADEAQRFTGLTNALGAVVKVDPEQLLLRDTALTPPGISSPNRHCQMVEAADGWLAVNLAREDDRDAVPAWLQCTVGTELWDVVAASARQRPVADLIERAILLGLPVAKVGEIKAEPTLPKQPTAQRQTRKNGRLNVLDMSALWAGPLCGGLLAEAGMMVTKIESLTRPDPTGQSTPLHNQRLNGRKRRVTMDLKAPELSQALATTDILITSARPHALARLGLTPDIMFARNPELIWVAITGYGFTGPNAMRVGFGDDAAAAGGLLRWEGGSPRFLGDALADPLTGLRAANLALGMVERGNSGLIDVALAPTAADFALRAGLL